MAARCPQKRGDAPEDCEAQVQELEARVREAQERLDACRDVQDVQRREQACCAELARTRRAAAELEAKMAAPPADREELRTRLRAAQAENLKLSQELARFRREQCVGACERDTCVGYEERIERLSAFFRGVIKEFSGRFEDPEATAERVADTLVDAANTCALDWLEPLLAQMQCRQRRAPPRSEHVHVAEVCQLERAILAEQRGLLLEQKQLRQRDAEVRRQAEALQALEKTRPAARKAAAAGRRRAPRKKAAEGLLRSAHKASSPPTPCDPPAPDGPPRGSAIPRRRQ